MKKLNTQNQASLDAVAQARATVSKLGRKYLTLQLQDVLWRAIETKKYRDQQLIIDCADLDADVKDQLIDAAAAASR